MSNTKDTQQRGQRRRLLQGAALTVMATAVPLSANAAAPRIIAEDHWAQKGAVKLYLYRKRLADDRNASSGRKPVLFLVHGSSFSGRGGFDLQVPDAENYSFVDEFARYGFDVWTMDHGPCEHRQAHQRAFGDLVAHQPISAGQHDICIGDQ